MEFCNQCQNSLVIKTGLKGDIQYYCGVCDEYFPFRGNIIESKKYGKVQDHEMRYALSDITYPTADIKCKKCDSQMVYYRKNNMKNNYVCRSCSGGWV